MYNINRLLNTARERRRGSSDIIKSYKFTILLTIVLFIIAVLFRTNLIETRSFYKDIFFASFNVIIILLFIFLFARTKIRLVVVIFLSLSLAIDISLYVVYDEVMNYGIMASIFETNLSEALGMAQLMLPVGVIVFTAIFVLVNKASKEMKQKRQSKVMLSSIIVVLIISIFVLPFFNNFNKSKDNFSNALKYDSTISTVSYFASLVRLKYPLIVGDWFIVLGYFDDMRKFKQEMKREKIMMEKVVWNADKHQTTKIIFVLGESSNRDHYSLYGYKPSTTPFLDSLAFNHPDIISVYNNVISSASVTREAIRLVFSFSTPQEFEPFLKYKNIIDMANDANYETVWLSNQNNRSWYENYMNIVASRSDTAIFRNVIYPDDLDLVPVIGNFLKKEDKSFIVVNIIGSHQPYDKRYDLIDEKAINEAGTNTDYDRTIHHTDRFLKALYAEAEQCNEDVLIYYISDHAEEVNKGHGLKNAPSQYRIPFIILQNKRKIEPDDIVLKYYNRHSKTYNASNSIFVLSEFMGYSFTDSLVLKAQADGEYILEVGIAAGTKSC